MKLSKRASKDLALLINHLVVAQRMKNTATGEEDRTRWFRSACHDEVEIADRYGIELPGLDIARRWAQKA